MHLLTVYINPSLIALTFYSFDHVAMNYSFMIGFALYILVGGLGALTMPRVSENMLQSMMSGTFGTVTEVCSLIFTLGVIGVGGIPLMR